MAIVSWSVERYLALDNFGFRNYRIIPFYNGERWLAAALQSFGGSG
jgi:hypothetical protein